MSHGSRRVEGGRHTDAFQARLPVVYHGRPHHPLGSMRFGAGEEGRKGVGKVRLAESDPEVFVECDQLGVITCAISG